MRAPPWGRAFFKLSLRIWGLMSSFQGRDILSIRDLSRADIELVLKAAKKMVPVATGSRRSKSLDGKILATLFYEPSTRTRLSFESAMARLGGRVLGFSGTEGTSVQKGETLADTIRMVESYSDAIVLRHPQEGAARLAAEFTERPVINAGDGAGQHPTQTLLDLYTIWDEKGSIEGQNVTLVGDLRYGRTVHSLTYALAELGAHLTFVSPPTLEMPREILEHVKERGLAFRTAHRLEEVMRDSDVLSVTRIQKGTVIDHIPAGRALKVLKILGIGDSVTSTVTVAMHVPSRAMGWKDIVKVEDRELGAREIEKIALIAPAATVNVIRNYNVAEKRRVTLPDRAVGILRCANPNCISNVREPIETEFVVRSKNPLRVVCKYCDRELEEIVTHIV